MFLFCFTSCYPSKYVFISGRSHEGHLPAAPTTVTSSILQNIASSSNPQQLPESAESSAVAIAQNRELQTNAPQHQNVISPNLTQVMNQTNEIHLNIINNSKCVLFYIYIPFSIEIC